MHVSLQVIVFLCKEIQMYRRGEHTLDVLHKDTCLDDERNSDVEHTFVAVQTQFFLFLFCFGS